MVRAVPLYFLIDILVFDFLLGSHVLIFGGVCFEGRFFLLVLLRYGSHPQFPLFLGPQICFLLG